MNGHTTFLELAAVGLDFRLTTAEQTRLDGHLASCPACRARVEGFHRDARAIAGLPEARLDPRRAAVVLEAALHGPARSPVPVLRLALVAALVGALAIGAALVGAELLRRMADDDISVIPPVPTASPVPEASPPADNGVGTSWVRVDLPDAEAPNTGGAASGVIAGGPGAIAWGWAYGLEPRIWTTADGQAWESATVEVPADPDPDILEPGVVNDIAAGGPGYVAVGFYTRDGTGRRGLVWTSTDGRTWDLVPHDPVFESAYVDWVIALQGGLVAIGSVSYGPDEGRGDQIVWTSVDGRTWERAEPTVAGGLRVGEPLAVEGRLWAAGVPLDLDTEGGWRQSKYLTSADGLVWSVSELPRYPGPLYQVSDGLLTLVQPVTDPEPLQQDRPAPGVYVSVDQETWMSASGTLPAEAYDLVEVGSTLVMVGDDSAGDPECWADCQAMGWRSIDRGSTWQPVPADVVGGTMTSVAALADGTLVAVGRLLDGQGSPALAAWVAIPRTPPEPSAVTPTPTPLPDTVALPSAMIAVTRGLVGEERWIELVDPADPATTRQLVDGADPSWMPDGRSLVFACPADGTEGESSGICTIGASDPGAAWSRLVSEGDRPSVSPDGTRLTIHRGMIDLGETWVAAVDGSGMRPLGVGDFDSWSPDGEWLAGMSEISGGIALRGSDGGQERALADGRDPAWSPDGRLVAFSYWDESAGSVRTVDPASGTVEVRFTAPVGDQVGTPTWLPDGRLVFVMDGDLWRLDAGADRPTRLTSGLRVGVERLAIPLVVSPDGDWLAFISGDPSGGRLGIASVDGGWRILDLGPDPVTQLAWRPSDG